MKVPAHILVILAALVLCFGVAGSAGAVVSPGNVGDGGGGACTFDINGAHLYNTYVYGFIISGGVWVWGYYYGNDWLCSGTHWYRLSP